MEALVLVDMDIRAGLENSRKAWISFFMQRNKGESSENKANNRLAYRFKRSMKSSADYIFF